MQELIIIKDYSIETYKNDLKDFYKNVKLLFNEIEKVNNSAYILKSIIAKDINSELDLKNNKQAMDIIINTFKPVININSEIKKTLNNWKSNFAGKNGLDTLIDLLKENLLLPLKQKQINYDNYIKTTASLKEQVSTKTTLGLRSYKKIIIDEIDLNKLDRKYLIANENSIKLEIQADNNITIQGVKFHIETEIK